MSRLVIKSMTLTALVTNYANVRCDVKSAVNVLDVGNEVKSSCKLNEIMTKVRIKLFH